jgi:hypothetical protein
MQLGLDSGPITVQRRGLAAVPLFIRPGADSPGLLRCSDPWELREKRVFSGVRSGVGLAAERPAKDA